MVDLGIRDGGWMQIMDELEDLGIRGWWMDELWTLIAIRDGG